MKPIWKIYRADDISDTGQKVWLLDGPLVTHPLMFPSLAELHRYMKSYHKTPREYNSTRQYKLRSGDSSTPKHPYDRPDEYWEEQDGRN